MSLVTLRQAAVSYIKQAQDVDHTLEQLSKQLRPKADRKKRVGELEAQKVTIENNIQANLVPYAQAICQHFCKKVLAKLPRELRELVYEHVVTPDYIYAGPQYLTRTGTPCEADRDAHYWDPEYVGEVMRVDLVQTWYRVSLFYFWDRPKNVEVIEHFMTHDRWGLGLKPYEHVARVRFDLGDTIIHHDFHQQQEPCIPEQYPMTITEPLKKMAQFSFPNRVKFLIRIHTLGSLEHACFRGDQYCNMLEEIIADLKALRSGGHRFRVEWSELDNLEFASNTSTLSYDAWNGEIRSAVARLVHK
ncbi:hypothetical protein CC86DRAFT_41115 [Ophiobolus disseminans]|uniref:Uncharacterized protein n=1 Tax=Ophiobolus disseminans TaxID=1469910 RepID=A0A6A6ZW33_9PLEO|nr:hypothetical protein CC86DRAFT_41115 [Ophiobolus disseminans]